MNDDDLMTEEEFYALPQVQHTVWCEGTHDDDGECVLNIKVADHQYAAIIGITGVPTSHQNVWIDGPLVDIEEIDAAIALLTQMRERLAAQDAREIELQELYNERVA